MDLAKRTDELFRRAAAGDAEGVAELCADGCRVKQNIGEEGGVENLVALIRGLADAGVTTAYDDVRRTVGDRAVVEQHVVTLSRPDGVEASSDVCVVLRFDDDGRVVRLDEYLDATAFAALLG